MASHVTNASSTFGLRDLRRAPESVDIPRSRVIEVEVETDPAFDQLYRAAMQGTPVAYTRVPTDRIQCGFSRVTTSGTELIESPAPRVDHINMLVREIESGHRPPLHLYAGGHGEGQSFVCTDDCAALRAYRHLSFRSVPAILLGFTTKQLVHPALVHRHADAACIFESEVTPDDHPGVSRIHIDPISKDDPAALLDVLLEALATRLSQLRCFHRPGGTVHYHRTLASVLARAIRLVHAIKSQLPQQVEQALVLARSLYELALNVHLDWLSPERVGPIFILRVQGTSRDLETAILKNAAMRVQDGWAPALAADWAGGLRRLLKLVKTAERKAAIHPLGRFHADLYGYLSHLSHQDFVASEAFLNVLDLEHDVLSMAYPAMADDLGAVLQVADSAVASICSNIRDDIGVTSPYLATVAGTS